MVRMKADLENQAAEKSSAESNLKKQLKETGTAAERAEAAYRKESPADARAKGEVVAAQLIKEELAAHLSAGNQAAAEVRRESKKRYTRRRESIAELRQT